MWAIFAAETVLPVPPFKLTIASVLIPVPPFPCARRTRYSLSFPRWDCPSGILPRRPTPASRSIPFPFFCHPSQFQYFQVYGEHDGTAALLLADGLDAEAVERAIYRTGYYGLDIITSNLELYAADRALYDRQDTDTARVLSSVLDHVRNDYDFCIIDNGPAVDMVTLNVLAAADDLTPPSPCPNRSRPDTPPSASYTG